MRAGCNSSLGTYSRSGVEKWLCGQVVQTHAHTSYTFTFAVQVTKLLEHHTAQPQNNIQHLSFKNTVDHSLYNCKYCRDQNANTLLCNDQPTLTCRWPKTGETAYLVLISSSRVHRTFSCMLSGTSPLSTSSSSRASGTWLCTACQGSVAAFENRPAAAQEMASPTVICRSNCFVCGRWVGTSSRVTTVCMVCACVHSVCVCA